MSEEPKLTAEDREIKLALERLVKGKAKEKKPDESERDVRNKNILTNI